MKTFISAGHSFDDTGATYGSVKEAEVNMKVRDEVKELLPDAIYVPDNLTLRESIDWVNSRASEDDLAIEIHQNANNNASIRGTETYYDNEYDLGEIVARNVSKALGIPNRGVKHDSESRAGSLGWIRLTKCSSALVECCYLSNELDRMKIVTVRGQMEAAQGIVNAITEYKARLSLLMMIILKLKEMISLFKR